jgi:ubiquinone/menaquinone biosynthesis C-methylase UbiE
MTKIEALERPRQEQRQDYHAVTEVPGTLLNQEQLGRFAHRYLYGAALGRDRRVLEVACGAGSGAGVVAGAAAHYVGLDYTAALLHTLRAHAGARLPVVQGDAERLPVAADAFDLVLCFEAIYYLAAYKSFLAECRRVLTDAGRLLIVQSNPDWAEFIPGSLSNYYPRSVELVESLTAAGFTTVQLLGALPTTRATPRQAWVNSTRRRVLRGARHLLGSQLIRLEHPPLAATLKRLLYGKLVPLPTRLTHADAQQAAAGFALTPLDVRRVDSIHRVHYFYAELPG